MNREDYLQRINYQGQLIPSLELLTTLSEQHIFHLPFENLDVHYGNPITLDLEKIYQKLIVNKRGGFCYELNGLFNALLRDLGFDCKMISARVYDPAKKVFGKEFDHLVSLVNLNQQEYIVDVGFGEFILHPLKVEMDHVQTDPRGDFIFERNDQEVYTISKLTGETKVTQYSFTTTVRNYADFAEMCQYHQSHPDSHFTGKKLITRPTKNGRITLTGNTLKITEGEKTTTNLEFPAADYAAHLAKWFTIDEAKVKP